MDETVARLNIEHYRRQLSDKPHEAKRETLRRLLAEEEEKLAEIMRRQRQGQAEVG